MKKTFHIKWVWAVVAVLSLSACVHPEDFAIVGTCIDFEFCSSLSGQDAGYAIELSSPDTIGGAYIDSDGKEHQNVIVCFGSDRYLRVGDALYGRVYEDPGYSKAYCMYHYRNSRGDVPECVFTQIDSIK